MQYRAGRMKCAVGVLGFEVTREKKYKLVFHNGSFKKKVLKYGTPKPSNCDKEPRGMVWARSVLRR